MKRGVQRLLAVCGIIGPILFTIVLVILGFFQSGYNHVTQYMSELGAVNAPYAIVMNAAGFCLLGFLIIAFAFGLDSGINAGKSPIIGKIGPTLVAVSGIAFVMTGFFPCDPGCVTVSTVESIHGKVAFIARFALIIAPLLIFQRLVKDRRWHNYHIYSLTIVGVALFLAAVYNFNVFENLNGALQRASFGIPLLWVEIMSIKLLRIL